MTKILVSTGYGAGWATWADEAKQKQIAEYQPIIEFIENGGDPAKLKKLNINNEDHPLIVRMKEDLDIDYFFTGGAGQLKVLEVSGPYMIEEYDGAESVRTEDDFW